MSLAFSRQTILTLTLLLVLAIGGGAAVWRITTLNKEIARLNQEVVRLNAERERLTAEAGSLKEKQKKEMVWYKIPELKIEFQVEKDVADNIGYRERYVEDDLDGYELYAKNAPGIRKGVKSDGFAYVTSYPKDEPNMSWLINCAGDACCAPHPSTKKLLMETSDGIICYSDDSFSKNLNKQEGVADEYDPITKKLFDGYLKNVPVRETQ